MKYRYSLFLAAVLLFCGQLFAATDVRTLGLKGDGVTDDTAALQAALGKGGVSLFFSKGVYVFGTVRVPSGVELSADQGAVVRINPEKLQTYGPQKASRVNPRCLFALDGSRIELRNLEFDFTLVDADGVDASLRPGSLIVGENCSDVRMIGLVAERAEPMPPLPIEQRKPGGISRTRYPELPANKQDFHLAMFRKSQDLLLRDSRARFMNCMIRVYECTHIVVENNRAENCNSITAATLGDQYIRHTGNWSREVDCQCRWWGGNANDTRSLKPDSVGWGTSKVVKRGSQTSDTDFNPYTAGAFDIIVANNYAEYGRTLAWGSKGRQIIFQGNISRFMTDYALGSEGGENVIFTGNIVINSFTAGLVAMYWSEKLVMTGNTILVRDEPFDERYSWYSSQKPYQGSLIRLHAAGAFSKSGAGQAIISGNLLSNELDDRPRGLGVEAGRDVLITGNKFRNGTIRTKAGSGQVTISANDFVMSIPHDGAWITLNAGLAEAVVRDNQFHNLRALDRRSPTELAILAEASSKVKGAQDNGTARLRVIEGNLIQGFPLALWARSMSLPENPDRFLIRNNSTDGVLRFEGLRDSVKLFLEGNISLASMKPTAAEILERSPMPLPPPVPTPEDEAAAASEGLPSASSSHP